MIRYQPPTQTPITARLREQVVQTAGPSPALLERLCQAAQCMGFEGEGGGEPVVELSTGPRVEAGEAVQSEQPRHEEKGVYFSYPHHPHQDTHQDN
jgi:hypothetical protein